MKCSFGISNFLEEISSLSHSVVFLCFFALIAEEGFLISSCYSLELCIQMLISFLFSFAFRFSSFHSYLLCFPQHNSPHLFFFLFWEVSSLLLWVVILLIIDHHTVPTAGIPLVRKWTGYSSWGLFLGVRWAVLPAPSVASWLLWVWVLSLQDAVVPRECDRRAVRTFSAWSCPGTWKADAVSRFHFPESRCRLCAQKSQNFQCLSFWLHFNSSVPSFVPHFYFCFSLEDFSFSAL